MDIIFFKHKLIIHLQIYQVNILKQKLVGSSQPHIWEIFLQRVKLTNL